MNFFKYSLSTKNLQSPNSKFKTKRGKSGTRRHLHFYLILFILFDIINSLVFSTYVILISNGWYKNTSNKDILKKQHFPSFHQYYTYCFLKFKII